MKEEEDQLSEKDMYEIMRLPHTLKKQHESTLQPSNRVTMLCTAKVFL